MTVTITQSAATVAVRAATSEDDIPPAIATAIGIAWPAAVALVQEHASVAPDDVHNAAAVRLLGWLWDSDPAESASGRALQLSGAANLLQPWRVHRAGAIGAAQGEPGPAPAPAGLPPAPASGRFVLQVVNGVLVWVEFPAPQ